MCHTYVLRSNKDNKLYVGSTRTSINERLHRHNSSSVKSTSKRRPLVLVYTENFNNYSGARRRELYLKSGSGREHLNRILVKWAGTQVAKGARL